MRWGDMRPSDNVSDGGSGGGGFPLGGGMRLGGGAIILIVVVSLIFGVNPLSILGMLEGGGGPVATSPAPPQSTEQRQQQAAKDPTFDFVRRVTGDTEDVWTTVFKQMGARYEPPQLKVFHGMTNTGCGGASKASGPFYCPQDRTVYLDTEFFQELSRRFGAPGDFAAAYVIAHEVGHHVQNQLGTMDKFEATAQRGDPRARNAMSRATRTAGRLLRGRVGLLRGQAQPARARRRRGRHACGICGWGRQHHQRPRIARRVHARHCGTAHALVQAGNDDGRSAHVQHVRGRSAIAKTSDGDVAPRQALRAPAGAAYFLPESPWNRTRRTMRSYSASTAAVTSSLRAVNTRPPLARQASRSYWHGPISGWRRHSCSTRGS